jgi:hypothetical protein
MMKKLVAALVLGALLLPVTVGCGNPSTAPKSSPTGTSKDKGTTGGTGTAPEKSPKATP